VRVCAEERVPIVSWHWGHPSQANRKLLREAGVVYWEQVGSIDDARRAVDAGAEVVIAQGYEAGGHNFQGLPDKPGLPTMALLPMMVDAVGKDAMVLGAGGISDGRGVAAALRSAPTPRGSARAWWRPRKPQCTTNTSAVSSPRAARTRYSARSSDPSGRTSIPCACSATAWSGSTTIAWPRCRNNVTTSR
jgi:hypothetical protein